MPPVMITNVQATASTPFTAVACRILSTLSTCRNCGAAMLKKTKRSRRLANASIFCRACAPNRPEPLAAVGAGAIVGEEAVTGSLIGQAAMVSRCVASCMMRSWVAPWGESSPVMRPSHMTTMRSLMRRISGNSDEIMTIALP